jgi:hypothetical protein
VYNTHKLRIVRKRRREGRERERGRKMRIGCVGHQIFWKYGDHT